MCFILYLQQSNDIIRITEVRFILGNILLYIIMLTANPLEQNKHRKLHY